MKRAKILLITAEYSEDSAGGAGVYAWEISRAIANNGTEIHVLAPDIYTHDENPNKNLFIHYKRTIFKPLLRMPSFSLQVWKSWKKIVNKYTITSIHSNNNAGVWVIKNIPMVTVIQHPARMEMDQFFLFQKILNFIDIILEKIIIRKSSLIISTSDIVHKKLLSYYSEYSNKILTIPIGINFSIYKSTNRTTNNIFTIFFPGGARARRKGAEYLFPALEKLKKEIQFKLIVTGSSREIGWKNVFKSLIKRHHLEENVELMGEVKYEDIVEIYDKADLVILPSTYEGYGIPILEALAMSKPIIATKTGEAVRIIEDGINGLLINTRDSNSFYKAINKLIKDHSLMKKCIFNSRKSIINKYSWNSIAKKTIKIHRNV